jgi:hypothetical protein
MTSHPYAIEKDLIVQTPALSYLFPFLSFFLTLLCVGEGPTTPQRRAMYAWTLVMIGETDALTNKEKKYGDNTGISVVRQNWEDLVWEHGSQQNSSYFIQLKFERGREVMRQLYLPQQYSLSCYKIYTITLFILFYCRCWLFFVSMTSYVW